MEIGVQKFGGTSVATEESRKKVLDKIICNIKRGNKIVVVVSAIGRKGDPYATDTLLQMIKQTDENINKREIDLLMSCGEIISSVVISHMLNKAGYPAKSLTGAQAGIITDESFGNAQCIKVKTKAILDLIENNIIPVVTGFQGVTEDGEITTLGRGGSDTTASIIGEAIKANFIEIYTDVDGIMTADPRICEHTKIIEKIGYNEIFQLADYGAKVIHKKAVDIARKSNIPLIIKNTFSDAKGTYICDNIKNRNQQKNNKNIITGIAHIINRTQFSIIEDNNQNFLDVLAKNNISIDMINIFKDKKVFTVDGIYEESIKKLLNEEKIEYNIEQNCCKITLVGNHMTGEPGIMSKIINCLIKNNIPILQTVDSFTTISCLIKEEYLKNAVNTLHKQFL